MLQVLACITQHHDLRLVAVAGFICLLASYTAMSMAGRAAEATGRSRTGWSLVAGIVSGSGIWATHFIGMLAFQPDMPVTYGIQRTVLSILIAIGMSGLGLAIALIQRLEARVIGGITIGLGIGIMHYLGMSALRIQAELQYDPSLMLASLVLGPVIAAMAIELGLSRPDRKHRGIGAVLLTVAICSLHFTGMAAAHILPNPTIVVPGHSIEPRSLAVAITAVAFMVTVLGLCGSAVDQYLADRSHEEAKRLRASETRFRQLANATFEGIVIHIGGEIVDANAILCSLIQRPHEWLVGRHILDIFEPNDDLRVREQIMSGPDRSMAVELRCVHRAPIPAEIFGQTIEYGQAKARVITVRDLSERRVVEAQIRHMVDHDALTGLPTRNLFYERLDRLVSRASASGKPVAVLCMDLDRFKEVNDLVGHVGGDAILRQCSERLTALIGAPETIARISGDEFAVVQIGDFDLEQTARLAGRLVAMIGEPFMLDTQQVIVGASVGIAVFPSDGASAEDLVRAASTAMRQAKEAGRNTYRFFEADMNGRLQNRRQLQRDLSQALALNQFEMHYQPLVDCRTGAAIGFEALIRWHHPDRGLVSPAEFIPLAEESGMIVPLGNWILETVCAEASKWGGSRCVAVNISPVQFRKANLAQTILDILNRTGLAPDRLEIEITEGVLIEDPDRTLQTLSDLKAVGVSLSLDDFGTGYSSLSYLQSFPFDKIKIDRSFVCQMEEQAGSKAIIRSVIALARALEMTVIAEGVETSVQLDLLRNKGCDQVQGYLLGRPAPARDLGKFMPGAAPYRLSPSSAAMSASVT